MADVGSIVKAMSDLDEETVVEMLNAVMSEGGADAPKALEACRTGMNIVGDRYQLGEYYVADLIYAGEIMSDAVGILKAALIDEQTGGKPKGKVLICTVKDDLHDIGKNIVHSMFEAAGYEVTDLGIDVPASRIVQTAKDEGIRIIALSGVLTLAVDSMKSTVDAFVDAGMRDEVKIIIGGSPTSEDVRLLVGADEFAHDPQKGVQVCNEWFHEMAS
jgi:methanogenic corrinoid protein MtbC1